MSSTEDAAEVVDRYRTQIWSDLRQVARPDSRFHWDFTHFIPDFVGSEQCAERVLALDALTGLGHQRIFIAPDNCLEDLRGRLLLAGLPFVMTTYGIGRGFQAIDPADVAPSDVRYAASLDGFDRFAKPVSLEELRAGPEFGLCVTGGSAVSRNGVRFGKGHGYFDVEFAILSDLGLAGPRTVVVDVVHDCQYVDDDFDPEAHDVAVDIIVTPTRTLRVGGQKRAPAYIRWEMVEGTEFATVDVLNELAEIQRTSNFSANGSTRPEVPPTTKEPT